MPLICAVVSTLIMSTTRVNWTEKPFSHAVCPKALRRCDFPVPVGPIKMAQPCWATKSQSNSRKMACLGMRLGKLKLYSWSVFRFGRRAR